MVQRIAYYFAAGVLLLAVAAGLAGAIASAIIRLSAPPAFGTPLVMHDLPPPNDAGVVRYELAHGYTSMQLDLG